MPEHDPERLYRLVTTELWCNRRYDLIDELIAEDFIDHIEAQGLEGNGRSRYLASPSLDHLSVPEPENARTADLAPSVEIDVEAIADN